MSDTLGAADRPGEGSKMDQTILDEIVRRIVEVAQPDRIILFGSAARGQLGPDSDVDLLVIKSGVPHRRRLAQQIHLSFFGLGVPIDVIVVTPEDIETYRDKVGTIIGPALQEGKVIYAASAPRPGESGGMAPSRPQ